MSNVIPISKLVEKMETEQLEPDEFERVIKYAGDEREAALAELARINKAADDRAAKDKAAADQFDKDTTPPNRFKILNSAELHELPPMEWLIDGLIPKAELVCVYGPRSSGKSFWTYALCCALERGTAWTHDSLTVKQSRCVYVYAEGALGAPGRDIAYQKAHGAGAMPRVILNCPDLAKETDALAQAINDDGGCDVLVIDTMTRVYGAAGADENSAKDVGALIAECQKLHLLTKATVILICHSGKDNGRGIRGSSVIEGAADGIIEIRRNGDSRAAYAEKLKDGQDGQAYGFKLEVVPVAPGRTSCVVRHTAESKQRANAGPQGKYAVAAREALKELHWLSGEWIAVPSVVDIAKTKLAAPDEGKKDNRAAQIRRDGLDMLAKADELEFTPDGRSVRKVGAIQTGEGDWLGE